METSSNSSEPYLLCRSDNEKRFLNNGKFTLGRALSNSYVVEHLQVSRTHCVFEEVNGTWYITDESSNGTMVNKKKIPSKIPQILYNGDSIQLSDIHEFVFVNLKKDSLDDIDLSGIIAKAETEYPDCEMKVTTENVNDVNNSTNTNNLPSTSNKISFPTIFNEHTYCLNVTNEIVTPANDKAPIPDYENVEEMPCASSTNEQIIVEQTSKEKIQTAQSTIDPLEEVENELQCIICTELFIKATTLNCSHSFCKYCIEEWRSKNKKCPICRTKITTANPTIVLDNFIAKVIESASDEIKQKRQEIIKSREKPEIPKPSTSENTKVLRSRTITPIEISSDEEDSEYDDADFIDYDDEYYDNEYNGVPGVYYGGYGRCYSCGERGHWANGCPYR